MEVGYYIYSYYGQDPHSSLDGYCSINVAIWKDEEIEWFLLYLAYACSYLLSCKKIWRWCSSTMREREWPIPLESRWRIVAVGKASSLVLAIFGVRLNCDPKVGCCCWCCVHVHVKTGSGPHPSMATVWLGITDNHQIEVVVTICTTAVEGCGLSWGFIVVACSHALGLAWERDGSSTQLLCTMLLCKKGGRGCCPCNN